VPYVPDIDIENEEGEDEEAKRLAKSKMEIMS
jgi:hypothetical protein